MNLKRLNEVSPDSYQACEGIHGIACDGGKRDAGTHAPEALSGTRGDSPSLTTLVVRVLVQAATRILADLELGLPSGTIRHH